MSFVRRAAMVCIALLGLLLLSLSAGVSAQDATPVDDGNSSESPPVTANDLETRNIALGVTMADGGLIPPGLSFAFNGPDGTYASGTVDAGVTTWLISLPEVPQGDYGYWVTGTYYSIGQSIPWAWLSGNIVFTITRAEGPLDINLDTSDGNDVPSGSTWSLTNSSNIEVASGTTAGAIADGGNLTTTAALDYGDYTLSIAADGYEPFSETVTINANPTSYTANLVSNVPQYADVTLTLTTSDSTTIPAGTTWSYAGQSGTIDTATASGLVIDLDPVLYGTYTLNVATPANAFTFTDSNVVVDTASLDLPVEITKQYSTVTLKLTSWDGSDIPAGTEWALVGTDLTGTISTDTPSGVVLDLGEVEYGRYAILVHTRLNIFYYYAILDVLENPLEIAIELDDTSVPEDQDSAVSLTIHVDDGTNIPAGTTWSLSRADDPEYPQFASGAVPPGSASPYTVAMPERVQWGQYVFTVASPALVYYEA